MADDVELRVSELARPIIDKDGLRALVTSARETYESIPIEREKVPESGNEVAALIRARAGLRADVELLRAKLPAAGKHVQVVGALFLEMNDQGKIRKIMRVRDNLGVASQLGIPVRQLQSFLDKIEQSVAA